MNTAHYKFWPARLPHELYYPRVPLYEFVETSARRYPDKEAIIYYGTRISYRELWDAVQSFAAVMIELGVGRGDRVALYLQNTPHFLISFFGVLRAGGVVVPVNPMLTEEELKFILADSGAVAVVTTADIGGRVFNIKKETSVREILVGDYSDYLPADPELPLPFPAQPRRELPAGAGGWLDLLGTSKGSRPSFDVDNGDLAMLPYTSGSTGIPKGCMHSHATIIANVISSAVWHNMVSSSTVLATLPFFHVTGLVHSALAPIYAGGTIVLLSRWEREAAIKAIEKYRCTVWTNITTMVIDLLNHPEITNRDLSSLLIVGGGGAPLPETVGKKLYELTGLKFVEGYGMTETISQTHFNPPDRPKMQCIGIPDFGVDARIIDIDTRKELSTGEEGELVINAPEVMLGYWNRPEETEEAFIEIEGKRFLRTGDICYLDEEGYFFVIDRSKRMINAAGFKVWPAEVEGILYTHPAVAEVCVVGVPDPVRVENVKAFVVLRKEYEGKLTGEEFIAWAKEKMAAYRYPRIIEFVAALPKSGTGKVQWRQLQQMERERVVREGAYWQKG
ncbi:long-chain-fatty-acid--CoA ligase [Desulfotomaculum copahuensis]|uniref:Long-chain fatty acid--CoA ligase n=1 Tax=Desulfotomaculum copahuensis TaxID=1838280 RepID=A0A1B7LII0_9FIRM|nr:long-chain-fatty-acid--CoA ligase [Desulfotomaculum copahuensis]OAT86363.1 long-chain fatty acid--CoA ligase [Desulfotomaculum copahuensis]